ncbi:cyclodeaminase/cyclohydrolase family protein [Aureibaculum marinum]|uniref:cyclodeaminase/cyclohydrolase family protein n=1 Tax=Aureibaculum marinum TaxID=2487930 RepID=UPI001EF0AFE1|nr:cyclodeaminase/cyclohydrolase family protein [Aureibaculum marinum]
MKKENNTEFINLSLADFVNSTSSNSIAPGGGSVAAYIGALGAALGIMVANISSQKKGWEEKSNYFLDWAKKGEVFKNQLLLLVDEDSKAYGQIIKAKRMPKTSLEEKKARKIALEKATMYATEIPYQAMLTAYNSMEFIQAMVKDGILSTASDAAVGILCARTTVIAAYFNVCINAKNLNDKKFTKDVIEKAENIYEKTLLIDKQVIAYLKSKM